MDYKPILHYGVRETLAPGETNPSVVPVITDRQQPVELETVVENCIDRGLIAGLKPAAAHGIAEGIAEQIAREFASGNGIAFGQYFYGRLYLDGRTDANGVLTDANKVNVRLYKGNLFKLSKDSFKMTFDGDATAPKFDNIVNAETGTRGEVVPGASATINGANLNAAGDTNLVKFTELNAEGEPQVVTVDTFTAVGPSILTFTCPASLVAGKSYSVQAFRTDSNGVTRSTATKNVSVSGAPAPTGPTLTGVHAPGIESPMIHENSGTWFDGTGLDGWTGGENDEILAKNNRAEEAEWTRVDLHEDIGGEVVFDGGMLKMDEGAWDLLSAIGIVEGSEVRFQVTIAGRSAEIVATVAEA